MISDLQLLTPGCILILHITAYQSVTVGVQDKSLDKAVSQPVSQSVGQSKTAAKQQ